MFSEDVENHRDQLESAMLDLAEEMITYIDVPCPRILDKIVQGDSIPVQGVEVIAQ